MRTRGQRVGPFDNCGHTGRHRLGAVQPKLHLVTFTRTQIDTHLGSHNPSYVNQFVRGLPAPQRLRFSTPQFSVRQLRNPKQLATAFRSPQPVTYGRYGGLRRLGALKRLPPRHALIDTRLGSEWSPNQDILQHDWRGTQCDVDALVGSDRPHNLNAYLCNHCIGVPERPRPYGRKLLRILCLSAP